MRIRERERDWVGHHMTGRASVKCENCMLELNHHIHYVKNRVFDGKFHFSQLFTALAEPYEIIMQNSFRDREMTNTCLSQLNRTPPASPPPTKVPHYTASLTIGFNTRSSSGFDNGPTSLQWE